MFRGYFLKDKKNGLGVSYCTKQNSMVIGTWNCDKLENIGIVLRNQGRDEDQGEPQGDIVEEIYIYKEGRIIERIVEDPEVDSIRQTKQYKDIMDFYSQVKEMFF